MEFFSIVFFLIVLYGFGSSISFIVKESEDFLERHLMRFGVGLGIVPAFGLLLNLLRVPLDWRIFIIISLSILAVKYYFDYQKNELFNIKFNFNLYSVFMLVLFAITLYMYTTGAFAYPYLEDDDPWSHAMGVKYVSIEKTVFTAQPIFHYIDPYPPTYDMLMGLMHQTNDSVYWTLKFFNALIISLSIIFFYFFARELTNSSKKALFSTFALFAVPAFLSHFIWALALTVPLYFVSFYCVERIKHDKKWWIAAAVVMTTTLTSSPTHSTYFGLFFALYFAVRTIAERRILFYEALTGFCGLTLSFALWWLPVLGKYGLTRTLQMLGIGGTRGNVSVFNILGTGDRVYTFSDFVCQPGTLCYNGQNMINNPIGIGIVLSILTVIGIIYLAMKYKEMFGRENYYKFVILLWFAFTFYAVNAAKFPIKISPFRAWMLLAIPVSLLAGEAINLINIIVRSAAKKLTKSNNLIVAVSSLVVIALVFYGIYTTSFIPKYKVNTAFWPPGAFWTSNEEIQGYIWLKDNIPKGSKVFTFVNNAPIIAFDKFTCHWCPEIRDFQKTGINKTSEDLYSWLKQNKYEYLIVDGQTVKKFGANQTNTMLVSLGTKFNLQPVFQNNGILILRI